LRYIHRQPSIRVVTSGGLAHGARLRRRVRCLVHPRATTTARFAAPTLPPQLPPPRMPPLSSTRLQDVLYSAQERARQQQRQSRTRRLSPSRTWFYRWWLWWPRGLHSCARGGDCGGTSSRRWIGSDTLLPH